MVLRSNEQRSTSISCHRGGRVRDGDDVFSRSGPAVRLWTQRDGWTIILARIDLSCTTGGGVTYFSIARYTIYQTSAVRRSSSFSSLRRAGSRRRSAYMHLYLRAGKPAKRRASSRFFRSDSRRFIIPPNLLEPRGSWCACTRDGEGRDGKTPSVFDPRVATQVRAKSTSTPAGSAPTSTSSSSSSPFSSA